MEHESGRIIRELRVDFRKGLLENLRSLIFPDAMLLVKASAHLLSTAF